MGKAQSALREQPRLFQGHQASYDNPFGQSAQLEGITGPVEYRTKEEQVADYLREAILSGHFPRGTRLKQAEVAKTLQISITPVREALKLLEAEGYISGNSYKGAVVAPLDVAASVETLNLRILLEGQLIRHAVERATTEDLRLIRGLADEFAEAVRKRDSAEARASNYRFHKQMYATANLPQTLHFVQILWARYPFDVINRVEGRAIRAVEEHEELLRAMIEGDLAGAMLALRRHIEAGWATVKDQSEAGGASPPAPGVRKRSRSGKEEKLDE